MLKDRKKQSSDSASIAQMVEDVIGCKWSIHVLLLVDSGVRRPGAMERAVEGLTAKVLNERLTKLTRYGILRRTTYPEVPPRVEYDLTDFGRRFSRIIEEIRRLQATLDSGEAAPEQNPRETTAAAGRATDSRLR